MLIIHRPVEAKPKVLLHEKAIGTVRQAPFNLYSFGTILNS